MVPRIKLSQRKNRVAGIFYLKYFAGVRPGSRGRIASGVPKGATLPSAKGPKPVALGVVRRMPFDARRIQRQHNSLRSNSAALALDSVPRLGHAEWAE